MRVFCKFVKICHILLPVKINLREIFFKMVSVLKRIIPRWIEVNKWTENLNIKFYWLSYFIFGNSATICFPPPIIIPDIKIHVWQPRIMSESCSRHVTTLPSVVVICTVMLEIIVLVCLRSRKTAWSKGHVTLKEGVPQCKSLPYQTWWP